MLNIVRLWSQFINLLCFNNKPLSFCDGAAVNSIHRRGSICFIGMVLHIRPVKKYWVDCIEIVHSAGRKGPPRERYGKLSAKSLNQEIVPFGGYSLSTDNTVMFQLTLL